ncbi:MAG: DUF192 domain-containing protein [Acidiferrobacterales bacterium]|nr:DUF192 domain-containing protein [Acidiferrobacterales bacterium]
MAYSPIAAAEQCQLDNSYLQAMPDSTVSVIDGDDTVAEFTVRTAVNNQTRAAGFQYVCASVIADKPILFLFDRPRIPSFHMRNVVAPIDIAFIDEYGKIESIQAMFPYVIGSIVQPLYSPSREVIAALEVAPGFYKDNNIKVGDTINWELFEGGPGD